MSADREAWLERRGLGIGGSDVPAILIALGRRSIDDAPDWMRQRARHVAIRGDIAGIETTPRIFAEKAGIVAPLKAGPAAARGTDREGELVDGWRSLIAHGQGREHETLLVAHSIRRAAPSRIFPLLDRHCPRLCVTPDAWAEDITDGFVVVQAKCTYGEARSLRWYWRDQVQAEIAAQGADWGVLVCGEYWARPEGVAPGDGPIRSWAVERDEAAIREIRDAVCEAWTRIEALREAAEKEAA